MSEIFTDIISAVHQNLLENACEVRNKGIPLSWPFSRPGLGLESVHCDGRNEHEHQIIHSIVTKVNVGHSSQVTWLQNTLTCHANGSAAY